jgi:hypothetical protein
MTVTTVQYEYMCVQSLLAYNTGVILYVYSLYRNAIQPQKQRRKIRHVFQGVRVRPRGA